MKANYKNKISKPESEVSLGNLYDLNKQLMAKEEIMIEEDVRKAVKGLSKWFIDEINLYHKYFMLLCNEARDYTLFNLNANNRVTVASNAHSHAAEDVIECMRNRGDLLSIEHQPDGVWEIWIRNSEDDCYAYYLFPYDTAVIEY